MNTRLASRMLAVAVVIITGCGTPPADKKIALQIDPNQLLAKTEPGVAQAPPKVAPAKPVDSPPPMPADPAGVLARKTESYARSMQDAMAKRAAASANAKAGSPDSLVQWLDPNEFKIGADDDANAKPSPAAPAVAPPHPVPLVAVASATPDEAKPSLQAAPVLANAGATVDPPHAEPAADSNANHASAVLPGGAESYESRITKRLQEYPRDVSANLDYQTMLFLRDQSVPDLASLTSLPTEDRELVSAVMDGLSNFRNTLRSDNNMLYSRKIRPLTDLADRLKQQAELSIPTLVLCTRVDGFGRYDPIEPARLLAQKSQQAIIYCELENFSSHQNDNRLWQTDVTQEAVLYTEDGMQVWSDKTQTVQDQSRNRRHDFFLRTLVNFPSTLTVGRYMLKVTIVDRQANRVAEASLPIQVAAQ